MVDGDPEFFANGVLVHNCYDALRYGLRALRAFLALPANEQETEEQRELQRVIERNNRAKKAAGGGFFE